MSSLSFFPFLPFSLFSDVLLSVILSFLFLLVFRPGFGPFFLIEKSLNCFPYNYIVQTVRRSPKECDHQREGICRTLLRLLTAAFHHGGSGA